MLKELFKNASNFLIYLYIQAIADIIDSMKWHTFAVIYETDEGLSRLQKTLTLKGDKDTQLTFTTRQLNEGSDYRPMLKELRSLPVSNIIIEVEPQNIMEVLRQAKEVNLLADYSHFVITYLVYYLLNFDNKTIFSNATYFGSEKTI